MRAEQLGHEILIRKNICFELENLESCEAAFGPSSMNILYEYFLNFFISDAIKYKIYTFRENYAISASGYS